MAEYTDKNEDAQTVIDALKKAVFRGRIRLTEFFSDFDPLRTGYMSSAKFRTALMASGAMPLNERQMQVLTLRYIDPTDDQRVRYLDLLQEIETVFTTANMQYDPHSTAIDFTPNLIEPGTVLPPAHEEAVQIVLARLSHLVRVRAPPAAAAARPLHSAPLPPRPPRTPSVARTSARPPHHRRRRRRLPRRRRRRRRPLSRSHALTLSRPLRGRPGQTKGLLIRQPFDDYVKNVNSPKQIDEVTYVQFRNALGRTGTLLRAAPPRPPTLGLPLKRPHPGAPTPALPPQRPHPSAPTLELRP